MTKLTLNYGEIKTLIKNKVFCLAEDMYLEVLDL